LGAHVHPVRAEGDDLDLGAVLTVAWELGIRSVLCEGGARLAATLLRARLAQRLYLFVAPHTLGASALPAFAGDAGDLDWSDMAPAFGPEMHGRDTLIVLDRRTDGGP
jgi:riboflavin biosynthesis pyrimidine reductase